ncbi:MAG: PQQ-binding-like beta-propeller repeat protein [Nitrososphaerota archaeon]|nr:PQQ-binding-like beta-propeller repeat protein [Nitrososphaerota archaeon]MDG6978908.1 PQQ-binding-like beta-propeller repeat protein [Nitrososphaerota archaeon]
MTEVVSKSVRRAFAKAMKKGLTNTRIRALGLSLLFLVSGIGASLLINPIGAVPQTAAPSATAAPSPASATPLTQAEANWEFPNANQYGWDYNPQNQINSSDIQSLGMGWIYPMPEVPVALSSLPANFIPGVVLGMDLLIVNGTAFAITAFDETFAFNIANGNVLWKNTSPLAVNQTVGEATGPVPLHTHDGNEYFTTSSFGSGVSGPTVWYQGDNNRVYALDAITGHLELNFTDFTGLSMVPGNNPQSIYNGVGASNIVINQQLGILVSGHDAELDADNGRGFFAGWNLNNNPPTLMWVTPDVPPQPGSGVPVNPYFDQQLIGNMSAAYTFYPGANGSTNGYTTPWETAGGLLMNTNNDIVVNWKSMSAAQLNATLYNDWGQSFQSAQCLAIDGGGSTGSTGAAWGGEWIVGSGQTAGLVFLGTNNKDPFVGPCNPGPDLWSASVLALNMTTGQIVWGLQTTTHDIWDYDCSWWQALANETINGVNTPVILKTCKDGYLFEINALTGDLIWAWDPPSGIETPGQSRCPVCYPMNPLNASQTGIDFPSALLNCAPNYTSACERGPQPDFLQWPSELAGFEDEQAFDPATNQIYATSHVVPSYMGYIGLNSSTYFTSVGEGGVPCPNCGTLYNNATTWDINAQTGHLIWHTVTAQLQGYRGQTDVSGNVVYLTLSSGDIVMLNAQTGNMIRDYYVGAPMDIGLSIGASASGQEFILVPVGTCSFSAITTCPGSTPGDIIALTLQGIPPSTSSASTTTVTSTSTTTAVSVSTVVSTSGSITTVTAASSGGISPGVTYGIAAVAVIFIIATGYLAMRGRKPAP